MKLLFNIIAASLSAALLAACGGSDSHPTSLPGVPTAASRSAAKRALPHAAGMSLYVANSGYPHENVTVYAPGGGSVIRTISHGIGLPDAMAFDSSGDLYVGNRHPADITVYGAAKKAGTTEDQGKRTSRLDF